jgi:hypothetical protein
MNLVFILFNIPLLKGRIMNDVKTIRPYDYYGMLVFDDPSVGLDKEPLILGVPEILFGLCELSGIKNPKQGFLLNFCAVAFDGFQAQANRLTEENGGWWYQFGPQKGWLCPQLFRYYDQAPLKIFFSE